MCRFFIVLAISFLSAGAYAQQSDFISFKKRDRTITNYFKGMELDFIHKNGSLVHGVINSIHNDTIFMIFSDVRMLPTYWGTAAADTVAKYDMRFHYNEIAAIPKPFRGIGVIRRGGLFIVGGATYAVLHTVNGLIQKDRIDPLTIAISGGVVLAGYGLRKSVKTKYVIGKKYTLNYVNLQTLP